MKHIYTDIRFDRKYTLKDEISGGNVTLEAYLEFPRLDHGTLEKYVLGDYMYFAQTPGDQYDGPLYAIEMAGQIAEIIYSGNKINPSFSVVFEDLHYRYLNEQGCKETLFHRGKELQPGIWYLAEGDCTYQSNCLRMTMKLTKKQFEKTLTGSRKTPYEKIVNGT